MDEHRGNAPYFATFAAMGVATLVLGPSIATLRHTTHTSNAEIGVLFTVSSLGYLVGSGLAGQWVAHRPVHSALRFGLVLTAIGLVLVPFGSTLAALVVIETFLGFGTGFVEIGGNQAMLWRHGNEGGSDSAYNGLHASFAFGAVTAPLIIAASLAWTGGLHAGYVIAATIPLVGFLLLRHAKSPPNPHADLGRGVPRGTRARTALGATWFFAYVGVELAFAGWIYRYGTLRGLQHGVAASYLGAAFLGAFAVGRIVSVRIARHLGAAEMLVIDHVIAAAALVVLLVGRDAPVALWGGTILFGLGIASMYAAMMLHSKEHIPATGTVTSLYVAGSALGAMAIPGSMGALLDHFGPAALPVTALIGVGVTGTAATVFSVLTPRRRAVPVSS